MPGSQHSAFEHGMVAKRALTKYEEKGKSRLSLTSGHLSNPSWINPRNMSADIWIGSLFRTAYVFEKLIVRFDWITRLKKCEIHG